MIAHAAGVLPNAEPLTTGIGVPPVFRRIVALSLPTGGGADALRIDAATTELAGSFGEIDFFAPAAAITAAARRAVFGIMVRYFMFDHPVMAWDPLFAASSAH